MNKIDIFVIGDEGTSEFPYAELREYPGVRQVSYQELISSSNIIASEAPVLYTFPNALWDKIVETPDKLYGVAAFGHAIHELVGIISHQLAQRFPNALFVNKPESILLERDKQYAKDALKAHGLPVAQDIFERGEHKSLDKVLSEIEQGHSVYIKVRYGSMGKGITYLSPNKWTTNFLYDGMEIRNHATNYDWHQQDVTGNTTLIERLIQEDVVIERGIRNPVTNGFKFDMRSVIIYGQSSRDRTYGRTTRSSAVTNVSQQDGQRVNLEYLENFVPSAKIDEGIEIIRRSTEILGFNFAGGDILFEGPYYNPVFIEVNSFPGVGPELVPLITPVLYKNILKATASRKVA